MFDFIKKILKKIEPLIAVKHRYDEYVIRKNNKRDWKNHIESKRVNIKVEGKERGKRFVFLIVIDCLRYDNIAGKRGDIPVAPFLSGKVKEGNGILRHYSTSSWTYPSVASILSGKYPKNHGGVMPIQEGRHFNLKEKSLPNKIPDDVPLLGEYMHAAGYKTYAHSEITTANFVLKGRFENFKTSDSGAQYVFDTARTNIKKSVDGSEKAFFYLHLGDLHEPMDVFDNNKYRPFGEVSRLPNIKKWDYDDGNDISSDEFQDYKQNKLKLYDTALHYVDSQIKGFVDFLRQNNLMEDSLLVITGDHGEEFWEHTVFEKEMREDPRGVYGVGHGHTLFEELIRLPLVVISDSDQVRTISPPTSHIDLVPTILSECGIGVEDNFDGESIYESHDRYIFSEELAYGDEMKSGIFRDRKVLYLPVQKTAWETSLKDNEKIEQYKEVNIKDEMVQQLIEFSMRGSSNEQNKIDIDKKLKDRLKNLGYI